IAEGKDYSEIADKYAAAFLEDCAALGIKKPHAQPRATEVMPQIIELINTLVQKGYAYESGGDVYFDTSALKEYGSLSGKQIEEQMAGARVTENLNKKHPADFTLWKKSKPGEPIWQSPWGEGRPGWHTECVVMSQHYLGESFDIHGGGIDLVFPHHENENAQAMALTGKPLARYWMHNGFLNIDGEKMSKSLKNFFTARDILKEYNKEAIRFFFLSKHYRSPIDFTRELIEESHRAVQNFRKALESFDVKALEQKANLTAGIPELEAQFREAMDDDFNTARAIALMFDLCHRCKDQSLSREEQEAAAALLLKLGRVLGFFELDTVKQEAGMPDISKKLIDLIIDYRKEARAAKQWAVSDKIRDDLMTLGIEIKDGPEGSTWTMRKQ
ncbi:MAG TPA: cysteine--tRNA ligase, partial [Candidatus Cloacimonadota bacterium]|nr:cysteine--tRNA ligase [Candidatus Cloacimonadota bacterium]